MSDSEDSASELPSQLEALVARLYPFCRSITGDGVRATLRALAEIAPIVVHEVPSGTPVLDWVVPPEWNITDAYVADVHGNRVIDFRRSNLHVVSYSAPIHARMSKQALLPHLHTLPDEPDLVPYRTSYYAETWGFCLAQRDLDALPDGDYDVVVDSTLAPGSLTYGEAVIPGRTDREILVSTHVCHPSLCDDNLSGLAVAAHVAAAIAAGPRPDHTIRFVFAPGTIGAITWLARNREVATRVTHGLTLTCLGDDRHLTYKRTYGGVEDIDLVAAHVLAHQTDEHDVIDFYPYGYDERQYNSPGFRMPVGSLMRGRHGRFREYHTSGDDLSFVSGAQMRDAAHILASILSVADRNRVMRSLQPFAEPQLGRRGLYGSLGGLDLPDAQMAMLWVLSGSDGSATLLDIADRAGVSFETVDAVARLLEEHGLLAEVARPAATSRPATVEDHA
jgi:aminopeptidase-like protein